MLVRNSQRSSGDGTGLTQDIETLQALLAERDTEIAPLREYIRLLKSQRFGATSERAHRDQLGLFNEAEAVVAGTLEEEPGVPVAGHTRMPRGRRPLPAWMPREEILHDLPEAEKFCPHDGTPSVEIARERLQYKERGATIECVNAQQRNRGLGHFWVRGRPEVRCVSLLHALAQNAMSGLRLRRIATEAPA